MHLPRKTANCDFPRLEYELSEGWMSVHVLAVPSVCSLPWQSRRSEKV